MIRYSVFYPATDGATFDHDYYRDVHVPMAVAAWAPDSTAIDTGLEGPFVSGVHFLFATMDAYRSALATPETAKVRDDVGNFTTIRPVRQVSETR